MQTHHTIASQGERGIWSPPKKGTKTPPPPNKGTTHACTTYIHRGPPTLPILRYTRDTRQIASGDNHESPKPHRPSIVFIHIRNSQPQPTCSLQGIGHTTHTRAILRCCACRGHDEIPGRAGLSAVQA